MKKTLITLSIIFAVLITGSFVLADYCSKDSDCVIDLTKDNSCVNSTATVSGCGDAVGCSINYSSNPADYCKCKDNKCVGHKNDSAVNAGCQNLYWVDDNNRECGKKEFCGAYMYQGLYTFKNETECQQYVLASSSDENNSTDCKNLYWFDNDNKACGQKQFCGAYMYYGLQVFENKTACENALNSTSCIKEGEVYGDPVPYRPTGGCCEGLKLAPHSYIRQDGGCNTFADGVCLKCGDKICNESAENKCNCPEDCGKACPENSVQENGLCKFLLSNGKKAEIKIMPETASQNAIDRLGELNFTIQLKEVGKGKDARLVYELTGNKQGKFLGIFKIMASEKVQIDAETGEVKKIIKPWWSFLASGV